MTALLLAFVFFSLTVPGNVEADCRFDQQAKAMHIPFDASNTDREFFVTVAVMNVRQDGVQAGAARVQAWDTCFGLPLEIQALDLPGKAVSLSHNDTGENCAIVDANGNARTAPTWATRISMIEPCVLGENENMFLAEYYLKFNNAE